MSNPTGDCIVGDHGAPRGELYAVDLGARLYKSRWLHEQPLDDKILLFAPDRVGMPVVVDPEVIGLLDRFSHGAVVGQVLAEQASAQTPAVDLFQTVVDLEDRGFLKDEPDPPSFATVPYDPPKKSMNVWLHANNFCNLACSYCFVEHTKTKLELDTADEVIRRIGSTVRKHGVEEILIKFAGGEPTLSLPTLEYFHEHLAEELADTTASFRVCVLTNGTVASPKFLDFLRRTSASISISLDGLGRYHDLYRVFRTSGEGSWRLVKRNIETLREQGIDPYINAMVGPKTCEGLPDFAEWVFGGGLIGTIHIVRNPSDSWNGGDRQAEYHDYYLQLRDAFEKTFARLEDPSIRMLMPRWIEIAELYFDHPAPSICCGMGRDHLVIRHDGLLASCPMTVHEADVEPGDDLFEAAAQTFTHPPTDRADDVCLGCEWYRVCASACPIANERIQGHPFTQSPLCEFWKYVIPRYAAFYGRKLLQMQEAGGSYRQTPAIQPSA